MPHSHQRIRPEIVHTVAGRPLRQYTIDGEPWFPIHDLIPILETTRNATQVARSLPAWMTCRLQITLRPATNMINPVGILELIRRAHPTQKADRDSRLSHLSRWAARNLKTPQVTANQKMGAEMRVLRGDLVTAKRQIESLLSRLNAISPQKEVESP